MWTKILDFLKQEISINSHYKDSRDDAKNRLKLVLMHDRTKLAPGTMEKMKEELIEVISKYVRIDSQALEITFEHESNNIALIANIPIMNNQEQATAS